MACILHDGSCVGPTNPFPRPDPWLTWIPATPSTAPSADSALSLSLPSGQLVLSMSLHCLAVNILTPQSSYTTLESILLQFPLGGIVFIFVLLTGYLSSRIRNICLIQLILCCFPVIAGCIMIWKSDWYHHAPTPVAGYTIIGFFGPVVFLIINIGMANVAGATKKSFTAAAIFVAYCVGNVSFTSCRMD